MPATFGEELKKLVLLGIGAAATTVEKSKEIVDELVKKGELTVEQGKVMNEELKHYIKKTVNEKINMNKDKSVNSFINELDKLTPDELSALKAKLAQLEDVSEKNNRES
jgi:polyhydroxyalkanoate synthesis regulator phasin